MTTEYALIWIRDSATWHLSVVLVSFSPITVQRQLVGDATGEMERRWGAWSDALGFTYLSNVNGLVERGVQRNKCGSPLDNFYDDRHVNSRRHRRSGKKISFSDETSGDVGSGEKLKRP